MSLISPRLLIALGAVVVIWAGAHLLTTTPAALTPAVWPAAAATPTAAATPGSPAAVVRPPALPTSPPAQPIPLLPGVLRRLNDDTGRTATGLYQLIQQLESAVATNLTSMAGQLEPHR